MQITFRLLLPVYACLRCSIPLVDPGTYSQQWLVVTMLCWCVGGGTAVGGGGGRSDCWSPCCAGAWRGAWGGGGRGWCWRVFGGVTWPLQPPNHPTVAPKPSLHRPLLPPACLCSPLATLLYLGALSMQAVLSAMLLGMVLATLVHVVTRGEVRVGGGGEVLGMVLATLVHVVTRGEGGMYWAWSWLP